MACEKCTELSIPENLCSENKVEKKVIIDSTERLYRRFSMAIPKDLPISALDLSYQKLFFRFNRDSYNRSAFSIPEDVLIDSSGKRYDSDGIFSIEASSLPIQDQYDTNIGTSMCKIEFSHEAEDCNYAHCELHCYVDGIRKDKNAPPPSLKTVFRRMLLKNITILKHVS